MSNLSRRAFFRDGLLTVGSGAMGTHIFNTLAAASAFAPHVGNSDRTLVIVQMAGGDDGLHAVAPFADPVYKQNRPTLALNPATEIIKLSDALGLNMKLSALKPLWDAGQMAIITNVGYPKPNLSHFQSMYIWQTLDLTGAQGSAQTGWLGKYLQNIGASVSHPFTGVDNGVTLATAFMAPNISVPAISSPAAFTIAGDNGKRTPAMLDFYQSFAQEYSSDSHASLLQDVSQASINATKQLAQAVKSYKPGATYPTNNGLASSLQVIATAITQGLGMRIGYATIGGFDTHANERATLDKLYPDMATAIAAFWQDLHAQGADQNVIMMTWSEFGRRVHENGSGGTDHGTAAPQFIFGPGVAGGIHGDPPDLAHLDSSSNLVFKTDFRSVYATILSKWMQADANAILGGTYNTLDFIK